MRTVGFVSFWLAVFAPLNASIAQSQSSVVMNGKTISVVGGSSHSLSTTNDSANIIVDDIRIQLRGETLSMDGRSAQLGAFQGIAISIEEGTAKILVDDQPVLEPLGLTDMDEQVARAVALFLGDGVERDVPASVRLLTQAAEAGHPTAQRNIGLLYRDGSGVPRDDAAAFGWLEKAPILGTPTMSASVRRRTQPKPLSGIDGGAGKVMLPDNSTTH